MSKSVYYSLISGYNIKIYFRNQTSGEKNDPMLGLLVRPLVCRLLVDCHKLLLMLKASEHMASTTVGR